MARPSGHQLDRGAWLEAIAAGQTITEIAAASGVERTTLTNLVNGHTKASLVTAQAVAAALGVEVCALFPTAGAAT